jgi:Fe2+ transport system protein FeoA
MSEEKTELFSEVLRAGRRAYSFDVKDSPGGLYLSIRELRHAPGEPEQGEVTVSFEHVAAFGEALQKAARFIAGKAPITSSPQDARQPVAPKNPEALWSEEHDLYLTYRHGQGMGIAELARDLGREPAAIRARLLKLGLIEGEGPPSPAPQAPKTPDDRYQALVEKARAAYPNALAPWKKEDDLLLTQMRGESVDKLAAIFQRSTGAIRRRLRKLGFIDSASTPQGERYKAMIEGARATHPKAWAPWKKEDDLLLEQMRGESIGKLAEFFQRKPNAIRSRMKKLGLNEGQ